MIQQKHRPTGALVILGMPSPCTYFGGGIVDGSYIFIRTLTTHLVLDNNVISFGAQCKMAWRNTTTDRPGGGVYITHGQSTRLLYIWLAAFFIFFIHVNVMELDCEAASRGWINWMWIRIQDPRCIGWGTTYLLGEAWPVASGLNSCLCLSWDDSCPQLAPWTGTGTGRSGGRARDRHVATRKSIDDDIPRSDRIGSGRGMGDAYNTYVMVMDLTLVAGTCAMEWNGSR